MRRLPHSPVACALVACALVACALTACASAGGRFGRVPDQLVIYPAPPDTPRVQFLLAITDDRDLAGRRGGWLASLVGEESDAPSIDKPYGVDLFRGRLYVCDSMLPGVDVIDLRARTLRPWRPGGLGVLRKPINCTVDPADGTLYVTDTERRQVVVFDSAGSYVAAFGEDPGAPVDVAVEGGRLYVADLAVHQVHVYDKATLARVTSFPDDGSEAVLRQPTNLWVQDGLVYVSDLGDPKVKVFRADGTPVRELGSHGRGLGQFVRPKGVTVDREGVTYVVDAAFQNVQLFDPEGRFLMYFGGHYEGPGGMWLPAKVRVTYDDLDLFREYVDPRFELEYLILVTNQYGPDRLNVYGFIRPARGAGP